jgi:AcrR family transcriptional regulator
MAGFRVDSTTAQSARTRRLRRDQILRCAKEVFSQKGYHNASVSDLITRAGIARGTFYLYFKNKRHIFDTLLEDHLQELRRRIRPIALGPGSPEPLEQLKANIRRVLELVTEEPDLIRILLHHASGLDQQSAAVLRAFYDRVLTLIERSLEHGIRLGLIRPCDSGIVAACILGTVKEVADWLTAQQRQPPSLDVLTEEIVKFGLRGLFRPEGAGARDSAPVRLADWPDGGAPQTLLRAQEHI